jgi:uncharacterized protein with gpF-like domain
VYRASDWHEDLTDILRKHYTKAAMVGAELESASGTVKLYKALRDRVSAIIKESVGKALAKGKAIYDAINETTGKLIDGVVSAARKAGDAASDIAAKVKDLLTGDSAKSRAANIARSETTAGLDLGQSSQRQEWQEDGYTNLTKTWQTMGDEKVRESHAEAEGQTVAIDEHFTVGGEQAYGPGDVGLSAENRCGCRCWTITGRA